VDRCSPGRTGVLPKWIDHRAKKKNSHDPKADFCGRSGIDPTRCRLRQMPAITSLVTRPVAFIRSMGTEEFLLKGALAVGVGSLALLMAISGRTSSDQSREQRAYNKDMRRPVERVHLR
jgi:hypothetical protein